MNEALFSSKNMNWCTPQAFFNVLNAEFHFTLDAAATDKSAKCKRYYTPETDGLKQPWHKEGGAIFCNPPYGRHIGEWVRKAYEEAAHGVTVVLLIPARTDTAYFHEYIYGKAEIRFVRGRLKFTDEEGNAKQAAPFPSMVVIYNRRIEMSDNYAHWLYSEDKKPKYRICSHCGNAFKCEYFSSEHEQPKAEYYCRICGMKMENMEGKKIDK